MGKPQLHSLFQVEVTAVLADASLSLEQKQEAVVASTINFGLGEEEAEEGLRQPLNQRCKGFLVNAVGDLLQGNEGHAVLQMQKFEQFAAFAANTAGMALHSDD